MEQSIKSPKTVEERLEEFLEDVKSDKEQVDMFIGALARQTSGDVGVLHRRLADVVNAYFSLMQEAKHLADELKGRKESEISRLRADVERLSLRNAREEDETTPTNFRSSASRAASSSQFPPPSFHVQVPHDTTPLSFPSPRYLSDTTPPSTEYRPLVQRHAYQPEPQKKLHSSSIDALNSMSAPMAQRVPTEEPVETINVRNFFGTTHDHLCITGKPFNLQLLTAHIAPLNTAIQRTQGPTIDTAFQAISSSLRHYGWTINAGTIRGLSEDEMWNTWARKNADWAASKMSMEQEYGVSLYQVLTDKSNITTFHMSLLLYRIGQQLAKSLRYGEITPASTNSEDDRWKASVNIPILDQQVVDDETLVVWFVRIPEIEDHRYHGIANPLQSVEKRNLPSGFSRNSTPAALGVRGNTSSLSNQIGRHESQDNDLPSALSSDSSGPGLLTRGVRKISRHISSTHQEDGPEECNIQMTQLQGLGYGQLINIGKANVKTSVQEPENFKYFPESLRKYLRSGYREKNLKANQDKLKECLWTTARRGAQGFPKDPEKVWDHNGPCSTCVQEFGSGEKRMCIIVVDGEHVFLKGWAHAKPQDVQSEGQQVQVQPQTSVAGAAGIELGTMQVGTASGQVQGGLAGFVDAPPAAALRGSSGRELRRGRDFQDFMPGAGGSN